MRTKLTLMSLALGIMSTGILYAQTPFNTAVRNYAYIGKSGLNAFASPVMLYTTADPSAAGGGLSGGTAITYTGTAAQNINGGGISPVDGYLYGLEYAYNGPQSVNGNIWRVGSDAVATQAGVISGPTTTDVGHAINGGSFVNTAAGTIDANGDMWFTAYTFTNPVTPPFPASNVDVFLGKVTSAQLTAGGAIIPTYYHLDISDPSLQTGYSNYMSSVFSFAINGLSPTNANGGFQDMDLNPADGKFYSYIAFPNAASSLASPYPEPPLNSYLVKIDVVNAGGYWGKVTLINSTPNTNPNYEEDGAYFDAAGNYYTMFTNGEYVQVDPTTGMFIGTLTPSGLPLNSGEMRGDLATNSPVVPLPVKLISFEAKATYKTAALQWKIADWNELANVEVERSAEGKNFSIITTQKQTNEVGQYTDFAPLSIAYYRLKMNTTNGAALYSPVIRVATAQENTTFAYPNPAKDQLTIQTAATAISLQLTDMSGRIITSKEYKSETGAYSIDLSAIVPATYLLTVKNTATGAVLLTETVGKL